MNKRQKKKLLNKHGYKSYYKRLKNCKNISDVFKLYYSNYLLKKMVYARNPVLEMLGLKNG